MLGISSLYTFFIVTIVNLENNSATAISISKTAGALYVGVLPAVNGKISHESLPPPVYEENQYISDASYYFTKANYGFYDMLKSYFLGNDEEERDRQLDTGVYKCHDGKCETMKLEKQQEEMMNESFEHDAIQKGNALTRKVKKIENHRVRSSKKRKRTRSSKKRKRMLKRRLRYSILREKFPQLATQ